MAKTAETHITSKGQVLKVQSHVGAVARKEVMEQVKVLTELLDLPAGIRINFYLGGKEATNMGCFGPGRRTRGTHRQIKNQWRGDGADHWVALNRNFWVRIKDAQNRAKAYGDWRAGVQGEENKIAREQAQWRETLAHEMIHVDQFSSGRCHTRYNGQKWVYTFSGEWDGTDGHRSYTDEVTIKNKTHTWETYRNWPWEQEAWEMSKQTMETAQSMIAGTHTPKKVVTISKPTAGKFVCEHCGKEYGSRQGRYNHMKKNHQ